MTAISEPVVVEIQSSKKIPTLREDKSFDLLHSVTFDRDVPNWIATQTPQQEDLDNQQTRIEEIELRVCRGIFGARLPNRIMTEWSDSSTLHIWSMTQ